MPLPRFTMRANSIHVVIDALAARALHASCEEYDPAHRQRPYKAVARPNSGRSSAWALLGRAEIKPPLASRDTFPWPRGSGGREVSTFNPGESLDRKDPSHQ